MSRPAPGDPIAAELYQLDRAKDGPRSFGRDDLSADDMAQIHEVMRALGALREVEEEIRLASERYMKLSAQDMRALHYLMVGERMGELVTPGALASHLGISAASTTKLLNRLERDGHIRRRMHPDDRRALVITVTEETAASARDTIGRRHARRARAAARLTPEQRETVIAFLGDMAAELARED